MSPSKRDRGHRAGRGRVDRVVWWIALAGLIRLLVVVWSDGTNDVFLWARIALDIQEHGLMGAYAHSEALNHPPLAALWGYTSWVVADGTGAPFAWILKLPALVGDAIAARVIWTFVSSTTGDASRAARAMAAYLLNPLTILLSSFHGNTDALYGALVAVVAVEMQRRRHALAGLGLGAALNVKLLPLALLPTALAGLRGPGGVTRFSAGAALALMPLFAVVALAPGVVGSAVFAYQPAVSEPWGLVLIEGMVRGGVDASGASGLYATFGRIVLAVGLAGVAVWSRVRQVAPTAALAAAGLTFLLLTPAFSVQYLALPAATLFLASPRLGSRYGWVAGTFLLLAYASRLERVAPLTVLFVDGFDPGVAVVGAVVWSFVGWLCVVLLRGRSGESDDRGGM